MMNLYRKNNRFILEWCKINPELYEAAGPNFALKFFI